MGDTGTLCTICNGLDHRASSCPRRKRFRQSGGYTAYGAWITRGLFDELQTNHDNRQEPVYTLKDQDTEYPSLKRLYLETLDPTEYEFAKTYLGGWDHWLALQNSTFFQPHLLKWRTELELKLKSDAFKRMREEAEADGRNAFAANKFIASQGWIDKTAEPSRRGRPSKIEIQKAAREAAQEQSSVDEDAKRLDLN